MLERQTKNKKKPFFEIMDDFFPRNMRVSLAVKEKRFPAPLVRRITALSGEKTAGNLMIKILNGI